MSDIQSNLIPGSIWVREKSNGAVVSGTVLCVTNLDCSERVLALNPQQVVFVTEDYKILSMEVERFLANRSYQGLDTEMAATIEAVTTEPPEPFEEISIDDAEINEDSFAALLAGVDESSSHDADDVYKSSVLELQVGPHPLADALEANFVGYSESPSATGDTIHTLEFRLEDGLTLHDIGAAFFVQDPEAIQAFTVNAGSGAFKIEPESYLCTMLKATLEGSFGCLNVITPGNFRTSDDPDFSKKSSEIAVGLNAPESDDDEINLGSEDSPFAEAEAGAAGADQSGTVIITVS